MQAFAQQRNYILRSFNQQRSDDHGRPGGDRRTRIGHQIGIDLRQMDKITFYLQRVCQNCTHNRRFALPHFGGGTQDQQGSVRFQPDGYLAFDLIFAGTGETGTVLESTNTDPPQHFARL